jgi:hypothetical protein
MGKLQIDKMLGLSPQDQDVEALQELIAGNEPEETEDDSYGEEFVFGADEETTGHEISIGFGPTDLLSILKDENSGPEAKYYEVDTPADIHARDKLTSAIESSAKVLEVLSTTFHSVIKESQMLPNAQELGSLSRIMDSHTKMVEAAAKIENARKNRVLQEIKARRSAANAKNNKKVINNIDQLNIGGRQTYSRDQILAMKAGDVKKGMFRNDSDSSKE